MIVSVKVLALVVVLAEVVLLVVLLVEVLAALVCLRAGEIGGRAVFVTQLASYPVIGGAVAQIEAVHTEDMYLEGVLITQMLLHVGVLLCLTAVLCV